MLVQMEKVVRIKIWCRSPDLSESKWDKLPKIYQCFEYVVQCPKCFQHLQQGFQTSCRFIANNCYGFVTSVRSISTFYLSTVTLPLTSYCSSIKDKDELGCCYAYIHSPHSYQKQDNFSTILALISEQIHTVCMHLRYGNPEIIFHWTYCL